MAAKKLPPIRRASARHPVSRGQKLLSVLALVALILGLAWARDTTLVVLVSLVTVFYVLFVGLKVLLHVASVSQPYDNGQSLGSSQQPLIADVNDPSLPTYTILAPVYKEPHMLAHLMTALGALQYPKDKLEVLLLLEDSDDATRAEAIGMGLPNWVEVVVVPDVKPGGKPKALNIGLEQATGAYVVVYDVEDVPDPDQLLKAVAAFRNLPEKVACLQARLEFHNDGSKKAGGKRHGSTVSGFYAAEYTVHYEFVLPGLARLGLVPMLGGTSNHFRTEALRDIAYHPSQLPEGAEGLGAYDPWNITEDCELAAALYINGYRVVMLDSVTKEEAPVTLRNAGKQRQRWLRGYGQSGLAHGQRPFQVARRMGFVRWFVFELMTLGTPISLWLNAIMWSLTITYFVTRSAFIESLFPVPLFYSGALLMVGGNLLLAYQLMTACLHRGSYHGVKRMLLTPLWWLFTSYSAYRMLFDKGWNHTAHGVNNYQEEESLSTNAPIAATETLS